MIIKQRCYDTKAYNYLWNGSVLQMLGDKGRILTMIPKKCYNEIFFTPHKAVKATVLNTIPQTVEKDKDGIYILIEMDK